MVVREGARAWGAKDILVSGSRLGEGMGGQNLWTGGTVSVRASKVEHWWYKEDQGKETWRRWSIRERSLGGGWRAG